MQVCQSSREHKMNKLLLRKTLRSAEIYKQVDVDLDSVKYFVDFTQDKKRCFGCRL